MNKKNKKNIALVFGTVLSISFLAGCNTTNNTTPNEPIITDDDDNNPHSHNYGDGWKTDENQHWHECIAEGCDNPISSKENHNFSDWQESGTSTFFSGTTETRSCSVCGYTETRNGDPRDFGTVSQDVADIKPGNFITQTHGENKIADGIYAIGSSGSGNEIGTSTSSELTSLLLKGRAHPDGTRTIIFKVSGPVKFIVNVGNAKTDGTIPEFGVFDGLPNENLDNFVNNQSYTHEPTSGEWYTFDIPKAGVYSFGSKINYLKVRYISFEFHNADKTKWKSDETNHWHGTGDDCAQDILMEDKGSHEWNEGVITQPAACGAAGIKTFTCSVCQATKTEEITALEHVAGEWQNDETHHWKKCNNSGCSEKLGYAEHSWGNGTMTTAPTFDEDGVMTYSCECGATKTEKIPALSHNISTSWSHDEEYHWRTCDDEGCNEIFNRGTHVWNEGVETTQHTCDTEGVKTFTCECGATKTEAVPTHDLVHVDEVTSTCMNSGVLAHDHCTTCNKNFIDCVEKTDQELAIPQSEHNLSQYYDADFTHHWKVCSNDGCGVVEKEEHNFGEGNTCSVCGATKADLPIRAGLVENQVVGTGSSSNAAVAKANPGVWTLQNAKGGGLIADDVITATTATVETKVNQRKTFVRMLPELAANSTSGGVFLVKFDLTMLEGQTGNKFEFDSALFDGVDAKGNVKIAQSTITGMTVNQPYTFVLLVKTQANTEGFQLNFRNSAGASYRVTITNVSMIMLNSDNCSEAEYGIQYAPNGNPLAD